MVDRVVDLAELEIYVAEICSRFGKGWIYLGCPFKRDKRRIQVADIKITIAEVIEETAQRLFLIETVEIYGAAVGVGNVEFIYIMIVVGCTAAACRFYIESCVPVVVPHKKMPRHDHTVKRYAQSFTESQIEHRKAKASSGLLASAIESNPISSNRYLFITSTA